LTRLVEITSDRAIYIILTNLVQKTSRQVNAHLVWGVGGYISLTNLRILTPIPPLTSNSTIPLDSKTIYAIIAMYATGATLKGSKKQSQRTGVEMSYASRSVHSYYRPAYQSD